MTAAIDQARRPTDQAPGDEVDQPRDQAPRGLAYTSGGATVQAVTIPEAAGALGVSIETVRRRLRKKQLAGQKLPTAQGFEWRVLLPAQLLDGAGATANDQADHTAPAHPPGTAPGHASADGAIREVTRLEAHVADLRTELAGARTELEARQREVQELHVIIARLTPAPAALPAPEAAETNAQAPDQAAPTPPTESGAYAAVEAATRPNWWRRAWTLVTGA